MSAAARDGRDATIALTFRMLGPLDATAAGERINLGGPKQRAVLALLLLEHGHVVSVDRLIAALWGDDGFDGGKGVLQVHISNLRRALEPVRAALGVDTLIETRRPGYVIDVPSGELDLARFEADADEGRRALAEGDAIGASRLLESALALWRGPALADLADEEFARGAIVRLEAMRARCIADRYEAELALDRAVDALPALRELVDKDPLDERLRGLLMLALYRSGQQAEALATFQRGRHLLIEELGIEPGESLRDLEARILQQDPSLSLTSLPATKRRELATVMRSSIIAPRGLVSINGTYVALDRTVTTIGRRDDRAIVIDDTKTSRNHAEIRRGIDGFTIVDTGSTNGTSVNGELVTERLLQPGDEILIGTTRLQFTLATSGSVLA